LRFQEAFDGHPRTVRSSTVGRLAPVTVEVSIYRGLADLPPFNPDADGIVADAAMSNALRSAIDALACAAREARPF
jgi:hypothetical protein